MTYIVPKDLEENTTSETFQAQKYFVLEPLNQ